MKSGKLLKLIELGANATISERIYLSLPIEQNRLAYAEVCGKYLKRMDKIILEKVGEEGASEFLALIDECSELLIRLQELSGEAQG